MHLFSHLIYFHILIVPCPGTKIQKFMLKVMEKISPKMILRSGLGSSGKLFASNTKDPIPSLYIPQYTRNFRITMMLNLLSNK